MATVYLAVITGPGGFNKLQVIKRLRPALAADPEFLQMFLDEARLAARINHPNVVQTNEVGFDGKYHYIAMEYLDGQPLEMILRRSHDKGGVPLTMHLRVIADALSGLHQAHELTDFDGTALNVVHRDMSPHNVLVLYDGFVKVLDFGIAKAADSSTDTRTGILKGKCAYMAPEQFGGQHVDRRADVFAVGIMLWQALTNKRMWHGLSDAEIFARVAKGDIVRPRSVVPDTPEELEAICMKALQVNVADRFATAAEMRSALVKWLDANDKGGDQRSLGSLAAELFSDHRVAIKQAIEKQLKELKTSVSGVRRTPEVPVLWSMSPGSVPQMARLEESEEPRAVAESVPKTPRRSDRLGILVGVAAAAAAVAVLSVVAARRGIAHPGPSPTESNGATLSQPAIPPANTIELTVRATPAETQLFLDDAPLSSNPLTSTFSRDGISHRLRAEAPGYVSKSELVVFDSKSLSVELALDRKDPPATSSASPQHTGRTNTSHRGQSTHVGPSATEDSVPPPAPTQTVTAVPPPPPPPPPKPTATDPGKPSLDTRDPWQKSP